MVNDPKGIIGKIQIYNLLLTRALSVFFQKVKYKVLKEGRISSSILHKEIATCYDDLNVSEVVVSVDLYLAPPPAPTRGRPDSKLMDPLHCGRAGDKMVPKHRNHNRPSNVAPPLQRQG